jgi:hypothetical protein
MLRKLLVGSALASGLFVAGQAQALTFNLIDTGGAGAGTQARAGFEIAAAYWSSVLTDDVTVNLNIGFQSLGGNILGSTGSARGVGLNDDIFQALHSDAKSSIDSSAVASLPTLTPSASQGGLGALSAKVNAGSANYPGLYSDNATRIDNDGSSNNIGLAVNTSVFKALGYTTDSQGDPLAAVDGSITFSSDFDFDFNPTDGIASGSSDFIGVAIHEIGHALGFVSGVDSYDYYTYSLAAGVLPDPTAGGILDNYVVMSTLDLFRYGGAGLLDWSTDDADKYFSIDGGLTKFNGDASFSTGVYNGDGNQASHWLAPADQSTYASACTGLVGIMNPYLCGGTKAIITADDLAAMDAIGWDISFDVLDNLGYAVDTAQVYSAFGASVPEAATWAQMIVGFGLLGASARRTRRRVAFAA